MAPPKKPKQTQSKENAHSESDTLEDDKQKPEMDMGSIAQTLKQMNDRQTQQYKELSDSFHIMSDRQTQQYKELSDSFHIMSDRQTQQYKEMNDRFDRNDSTMQSIHKALIFNSIQFNNFIPDSTEHIQQVYVTLRSICYIRYTICAVYKSTEQ